MAFTELVDKLPSGSRNLNTSPWTATVKGDSSDIAFMVFCDSGSTASNELRVTFNSDTGANYERYHMRGNGTSKGIGNLTAQNEISIFDFTDQDGSRNSLCIGVIRGDSSQDRTLTYINSSGNPRITQGFGLWTNNVDELDEVTFTSELNASCTWEIYVWAVPKLNNNSNFELVNSLSWSASSTEQSFTGLTGDTDKHYKILWDGDDTSFMGMEINNDAGANYDQPRMRNTGSAFVMNLNAGGSNWSIGKQQQAILNAETGDERTGFMIGGPLSTDKQMIRALWYQNTVNEVASLYFTPNSSTTSELKLFRSKYPSSCIPDMFDLPFEKVDEFSVNTADFTSGQSFTGLEGDKVLLYRLEWKGISDGGLLMRPNSDSGANDYAYQHLIGSGTTETAGSSTGLNHMLAGHGNTVAGTQQNTVTYFYPQSGEYRPLLQYAMLDEKQIQLWAWWYQNSISEVTSLQVFGGVATYNGTFTLSAIYL